MQYVIDLVSKLHSEDFACVFNYVVYLTILFFRLLDSMDVKKQFINFLILVVLCYSVSIEYTAVTTVSTGTASTVSGLSFLILNNKHGVAEYFWKQVLRQLIRHL